MPAPAVHPSERFWGKVQVGSAIECWEWRGARYRNGYGFLFAGPLYPTRARFVKAHRLSWEIANGEVPEGLCVLHHCDNPSCVNPAHLYVGTRRDNARDRAVRKRGKEQRQRGEQNDNSKLVEADVREIIAALERGETQISVAAQFGIKQPQVSRIARRVSWAHLWDE
jgi:hypothetical protein